MSASTATARSSYIPRLFVAGFAIVFLVNGLMIWLAVGSFSGLYGNGARDREAKYNDVIAQQKVQDALGWKIGAKWQPAQNRLQIDLVEANGTPLQHATITALLIRPAEKRPSLPLEFDDLGSGRFEARVALPARGNWDLDILVVANGQSFAQTKRLFLQ